VGRDFDLSRNTSLRTLETTAISITEALGAVASQFLKAVLSTVTSPLPLDFVVNYYAWDVGWHRNPSARLTRGGREEQVFAHRARFKAFSEMYTVREFRLVFCADVCGSEAEAMPLLERIVEAERTNGGFDYLSREPSVIIRTNFADIQVHPKYQRSVAFCVL